MFSYRLTEFDLKENLDFAEVQLRLDGLRENVDYKWKTEDGKKWAIFMKPLWVREGDYEK